MLRNYLAVALRSLARNRFYSLVNIVGLGAAMAMCVVAYVNFEYALSYDTYHENRDDIYLLQSSYQTES